ncbi:nitrate/TMAO reductase membrane-bound tetraheme cytochrome C subunit [Desulfosporosinus sp. HMP52]|uniref:NapC/NirT family cytochrome c n=1 Tax=Desulfosporosinus sp. HMP52 TaxID=1487923 RepID=UPI00051FEEA2|nr:NapC/NirT family cytochrome c [Desulfosporosinus sp. HMP52]KGK88355.1 nitrate/TMAO reductase membrane-bound tetraheme cytochrome C subunit [Desulfosporosinus sp. HMP52]
MKPFHKGLIILGLVFLAFYIPFRITYAWYTTPSSCQKCHEVAPYYTSWQKSAHKNTDCMDCHVTRGPFHRLDSFSRGIRDVAENITGDYGLFTNSIYYNSNCIACHIGNFKPESNAPIMPDNHAIKIKKGLGCNNCHRDTGHKNGLGVDLKFEP